MASNSKSQYSVSSYSTFRPILQRNSDKIKDPPIFEEQGGMFTSQPIPGFPVYPSKIVAWASTNYQIKPAASHFHPLHHLIKCHRLHIDRRSELVCPAAQFVSTSSSEYVGNPLISRQRQQISVKFPACVKPLPLHQFPRIRKAL